MTESRTATHWVLRMLRSAGLVYLGVCLVLAIFQRSLIYHPPSEPGVFVGLHPKMQTVRVASPDGTTIEHGYVAGSNGTTLVVFHGNAGSAAHRMGMMRPFAEAGYGVFLAEYPGYGTDGGSPNEAALYAGAKAAIDWLAQHSEDRLVYFGESLGTGVSVEMAVRKPPAALVLTSAYSSVANVAAEIYWMFPVRWLLVDRFDSESKISRYEGPLLMFHGSNDQLIPMHHGRRVFDLAPGPKEWVAVKGAGHNTVVPMAGDDYFMRTDVFLQTHVR